MYSLTPDFFTSQIYRLLLLFRLIFLLQRQLLERLRPWFFDLFIFYKFLC